MLKKQNRLKKRYQFNYVYRAGEHFSGKFLVLYVTPSKTKDIKVGLAVTKKIGHAVKRNLVRRRLREIIQKQLPNLKQNYNIIVVTKEGILDASFTDIELDFVKLTKRANILVYEEGF